MLPTRQLRYHLNNKQVNLFRYFFSFFSFFHMVLLCCTRLGLHRQYERDLNTIVACDRSFLALEQHLSQCIMRLSTSSFSVCRLMERWSAVVRCEFPRFSVSPVTLSYFRRPHRNWKVRLIPRRIQSSDNFSEESSVTFFHFKFI